MAITLNGTTGAVTGATSVGGLTIPSTGFGKVLQITQSVLTTQFTTASTSFVDLTGMSATITPTSASSRIMVNVNLGAVGNNNSAFGIWINLVRNGTNIAQPTDGTNKQTMLIYNNDAATGTPASLSFLDSPSTTSALTYKLQIRGNGGTVVVNRIAVNTDWSCISTITLTEIGP